MTDLIVLILYINPTTYVYTPTLYRIRSRSRNSSIICLLYIYHLRQRDPLSMIFVINGKFDWHQMILQENNAEKIPLTYTYSIQYTLFQRTTNDASAPIE